jgi:hypothetical protein
MCQRPWRTPCAPAFRRFSRLTFDGSLTLPSGVLVITDVEQSERQRMSGTPGSYRVAVGTNDEVEPTVVEVRLEPAEGQGG